MSDELKLGRFGKQGSVNLNNVKGGIKKEALKDAKMEALFKFADKNKDGILDQNEIQTFKQGISDAAGNSTLSKREAGKYLKENGVKDVNKKDVLKFLGEISQASENIESSTVNDSGVINIKYKDGLNETVNPDKTSILQKDNNTKYLDADKKLTKEINFDDAENKTEILYGSDEKPTQLTTTAKGGNPVTVVKYDELGPASKEVRNGNNIENYGYDEQGKEFLTRTVENNGIPTKEKVTDYQYNQDGSVTTIAKEHDKTTTTTTSENGKTETIKTNDGTVTQNTYNKNNNKLSQTKVVNGQEYSATYDGEGNTTGIVVQNGESIDALAKKFGCTKQEIIDANPDLIKGKQGKEFFTVGQEIKIPKEIESDDTALQGRKTSEEAISDYKKMIEQRRAEQEEIASRKPISFTEKKYQTFNDIAKGLYEKEGVKNPTKKQLEQRAKELKELNPNIKEGEIIGKRITAKVAPDMHQRIADKEQAAKTAQKDARNNAVNIQNKQLADAKAAFEQQLAEDGWAGDLADGISVLWGSDNRASKVRKDLENYEKQLKELNEANKQGDSQFKAKFKEIYGVDYNSSAIARYQENPTEANYKKAYGTKHNIAQRVAVYNKSQQDGAAAVKTTVVAATATAAAVATGGASLAATMAIAAGTTMAARTAVEVTDLATNDIEGDINGQTLDDIAEQAMVEGVIAGGTAGVLKGVGNYLNKIPKNAPKSVAPKTPSPTPKGLPAPETTTPAPKGLPAPKTSAVSKTTAKPNANATSKTGSAGQTSSTGGSKPNSGAGAKSTGSNTAGAKPNGNAGKTGNSANSANNAGNTTGTKAGTSTAGSSTASATSQADVKMAQEFLSKISSKSDLANLSSVEKNKLADFLGISPAKLSNLSKSEFRQLIVKFHPDRYQGSQEFAEAMTKILNKIR